jgi:hypothetical protein
MMKLARLVLMLFLVAGWAAAQSGTTAATEKSTKDSAAKPMAMSCGCCKDMANKDGVKAGAMGCCAKMAKDKDAAGGMGCCAKMAKGKDAAGMACCAKMGKDKDAAGMGCCAKMAKDKEAAGAMGCCAKMGGGMKCGGGSDSKPETPEQKMK